jgi:hypothetical protein
LSLRRKKVDVPVEGNQAEIIFSYSGTKSSLLFRRVAFFVLFRLSADWKRPFMFGRVICFT